MAEYSTLGLRTLPYTLVLNPVEGGFAPTPMGRRGIGFPIGPIGTGRAAATAQVGETVDRGENFDGTPSSSSSSLGGYLGSIKDAIVTGIEGYMGVPKAVNPLTGTVRATGVPGAVSAMMPGFFGPLMEAGYKANMANLSRIAGMSQVSDQYSTGLVGDQLVGVEPTSETFGGKVLEALGFNVEGYTLSGNIGGFTNVDTEAYEAALISSLLGNQPTAYGPGRAVAMGLDPQVTYSQVELIQDVASKLGIDPFSPSSQYAFGGAYAPFVEQGGNRPDPTRPGGIVGSYDADGNWKGVTSGTYTSVYGLPGMTDFAFYNMGAGYSAADMTNLEGTGGTDFSGIDPTGTAGAFTGQPVGMDDEYDNDPGGHTPSGSYGSYSDLGGSPHDNTGGGGGGDDRDGGSSSSGGGSSCFAAGTKFFMEDGSLKNIEDIKIGDVLQKGGKVRTVIVGDGLYETWFLYGSTKVTGTHTVFENNTWKRVQNSDNATPTDKDEFVYTLINENHRLVAEDGIMFGDYDEVDNLDIEDDLLAMMNEMHNA